MFQSQKASGNHYGEDTIDVKALLKRLIKRWPYYVVGVTLMGALGAIQLYQAPKIWRVKAKVILNNQNAENLGSEFMEQLGLYVDKSGMEDKIGVLKSYNLVKATAAKLPVAASYYSKHKMRVRQHYKDVPFSVSIDSSHNQLVGFEIFVERLNDQKYRITGSGSDVPLYSIENQEVLRELDEVEIDETLPIGTPYEDSKLAFSIQFKEDYDTYTKDEYFFKINTLDGLAEAFQGGLKVEAVSDESNIISLTSDGPLVEIEKQFINTLLETYKEKELFEMNSLGMKVVALLDSQLTVIGEDLALGQNVLEQNMITSGTMDPSSTEANIQNTINLVEQDRIRAKTAFQYYLSVLSKLENSDPSEVIELPSPSSLGINDQVLNSHIIQLSELFSKRQELTFSTAAKGPLFEVNELKIKNKRREIISNVRSAISAKDTEIKALERRLGSLQGRISSLPRGAAKIDRSERNVQLLEERYKLLVEKKTDALMALQSNTVDIEVIESARQEGRKPISPQKSLTLLIVVFLGAVLPTGVILLRDFFDNKIGGKSDIEASTNIPVIGFIARHDRNSNYIVPKDSRTALAESFRSIRIKMQYLNDDVHQQVIGLTSSASGEGKTFCATNLAAIMAQAGKRTLLMDVDLRRPRVTRYFENGDGRGLSTYLSGEIEGGLDEIIHQTHIENLDVIHSGPVTTNPMDLLSTSIMTETIESLRQEYDHIVLDTPPVGLVSDYLVIMKLTDFNIYVVRDSTTNVDSLKWINELYDNEKITNVGLLINDVKSVAAYGYIENHYGYGE